MSKLGLLYKKLRKKSYPDENYKENIIQVDEVMELIKQAKEDYLELSRKYIKNNCYSTFEELDDKDDWFTRWFGD